MKRSPLFSLLVGVAACAGRTTSEPAPATGASPAQPERVVGPPDVAWKDMTKEQRGAYMDAVVVPKMKEIFTAHDAEEFAEFGCGTCHGKSAEDGSFTMPNPALPVLPGDAAGFEQLAREHPDDVKWMSETVKPAMAALLGKEELDPSRPKPDTVSCGTCHTTKAP